MQCLDEVYFNPVVVGRTVIAGLIDIPNAI